MCEEHNIAHKEQLSHKIGIEDLNYYMEDRMNGL